MQPLEDANYTAWHAASPALSSHCTQCNVHTEGQGLQVRGGGLDAEHVVAVDSGYVHWIALAHGEPLICLDMQQCNSLRATSCQAYSTEVRCWGKGHSSTSGNSGQAHQACSLNLQVCMHSSSSSVYSMLTSGDLWQVGTCTHAGRVLMAMPISFRPPRRRAV